MRRRFSSRFLSQFAGTRRRRVALFAPTTRTRSARRPTPLPETPPTRATPTTRVRATRRRRPSGRRSEFDSSLKNATVLLVSPWRVWTQLVLLCCVSCVCVFVCVCVCVCDPECGHRLPSHLYVSCAVVLGVSLDSACLFDC